jgi:adenosylhomocysteine nucleosidase
MKVLITFAVDAEFAPWRELRHFEKQNREGTELYSATIENAEILVLLTGIGGKKAGVEATKAIWDGDIDVCISSGLAGALKSEHRLSDVLAARRIDTTSGKQLVVCDESLALLASEFGAKIADCFYSVDHVVSSAAEKQELGKTADAVEMESGEILSEAAAFGARVIAVRGISDAADEDLPLDFNLVTTDSGDVSMKSVLVQVARRPQSIPGLIRFGKQSRHAAEKLSKFLDLYVAGVVRAGKVLVSGGVAAQ